jgi:hypothetical protein
MDYFIVAILQIIQSVLKVFDIKYSYENKVVYLTVITVVMSAIWLIATTIGVSAVLSGDAYMMIIYIVSSGLGKIIAIQLFGNPRYKKK